MTAALILTIEPAPDGTTAVGWSCDIDAICARVQSSPEASGEERLAAQLQWALDGILAAYRHETIYQRVH
jgi:hypothetical protein